MKKEFNNSTSSFGIHKVHISKLQVRSPFKDIFRVKKETLGAIIESISKRGFDPNRPIETIKEGGGMYTIIDGHARKQAVDDIIRKQTVDDIIRKQTVDDIIRKQTVDDIIKDVSPTECNLDNLQSDSSLLMYLPIIVHKFENEYDAIEYVRRNQFERRDFDDIDLLSAAELACGIYEKRYGKGNKAEYLSKLLPGLSVAKAKQLCVVLDRASEEQIKSIRAGEITIYATYKLVKEEEDYKNIGNSIF